MADAEESANTAATQCTEHSTQEACKDIADAAGTVTQKCKWDSAANPAACVNDDSQ